MTLLTAHLIQGKKVALEVPIPGAITEPFKIEDTVSDGYADISSILNWDTYGWDLNRDYLFIRKEIKKLVEQKAIDSCISTISDPPVTPTDEDRHYIDPDATATGDWTGYEGFIAEWDATGVQWVKETKGHVGYRLLTSSEKTVAAKLKIGSVADHFTELGVPSVVDIGEEYHKNAMEARKARMLRATVEFYNRLPTNYATVLQHLTANANLGNMIYSYEEWGLKGAVEDYNIDFNPSPIPGCMDYLMARAPFDGVQANIDAGYPEGIRNQSWTTVDGLNMTQFSDELYDILVNGIYH